MEGGAPVIAIDGPAASGKGTVGRQVAETLGFHYLDSGKLYRAVALAGRQRGIDATDSEQTARLVQALVDDQAAFANLQQSTALAAPETGQLASIIAKNQILREILLPLQRAAQQPPGLVADGRDMGTVVFPSALLRVFLTASTAARARRRRDQLQKQGICARMEAIRADIEQRDRQDSSRAAAPLKPAADALIIDSTDQSIDDIAGHILRAYRSAVS